MKVAPIAVACLGVLGTLFFGDARAYPIEMVSILVVWGLLLWAMPRSQLSLPWLLFWACLLRMAMVWQEPSFSDDLYRYLWEGRAIGLGHNPYTEAPATFSVLDGIRERVNHPAISAIYPPVAQFFFWLIGKISYSPIAWQSFTALCDIGIIFGLWKLVAPKDRDLLTLYALHPLAIIESASSAHIEFLSLLFLVWGVVLYREKGRGHWLLFFGGWTKLFPWVFLPFLRGWRWWHIVGMALLSLGLVAPFVEPQMFFALGNYTEHWEFNSSFYALFHWLSPAYARWLCFLCGALLYLWVWLQKLSLARSIFWIGGGFVLFSPTLHPWYGMWVWIPALMVGNRSWNLFASLLPLSYIALVTIDPISGSWSPPLWPSLVIYTALSHCLLVDFAKQRSWMPS